MREKMNSSRYPKCPRRPTKPRWRKTYQTQLFGRKYWPALATLEFLALIGASLNSVLSRKRRLEIERLNVQIEGDLNARRRAFRGEEDRRRLDEPSYGVDRKGEIDVREWGVRRAIALFQDALDAVKPPPRAATTTFQKIALSAERFGDGVPSVG